MSIKKSQAILKCFIDLKFSIWFTLGSEDKTNCFVTLRTFFNSTAGESQNHLRENHCHIYLENWLFSTKRKVLRAEESFSNDQQTSFLTSTNSSSSEVFVYVWLSLEKSISKFTIVSRNSVLIWLRVYDSQLLLGSVHDKIWPRLRG